MQTHHCQLEVARHEITAQLLTCPGMHWGVLGELVIEAASDVDRLLVGGASLFPAASSEAMSSGRTRS
jgi:hypothetical protein